MPVASEVKSAAVVLLLNELWGGSDVSASSYGFVTLASFLRGVKDPGGRCYMRERFVVPFLVLQWGLHRNHSAWC